MFAPFTTFLLVLTRVSGWVMTVPFFGSAAVPVRFRAFIAIGLSLLLTPVQHTAVQSAGKVQSPTNLVDLVILLSHELLIGLAMGLAILILFAGLQLAGQLISTLGGMAAANIFDPTSGTSAPVFSQFLRMLGVTVFMTLSGHRQVMAVMLDSYIWMPPGDAIAPSEMTPALVEVLGLSFVMGLRAAAPILVALMLSMLILGLISRTLPQLNILAVGFSLNAIVALGALLVSLTSIYYLLDSYTQQTIQHLLDTIRG